MKSSIVFSFSNKISFECKMSLFKLLIFLLEPREFHDLEIFFLNLFF